MPSPTTSACSPLLQLSLRLSPTGAPSASAASPAISSPPSVACRTASSHSPPEAPASGLLGGVGADSSDISTGGPFGATPSAASARAARKCAAMAPLSSSPSSSSPFDACRTASSQSPPVSPASGLLGGVRVACSHPPAGEPGGGAPPPGSTMAPPPARRTSRLAISFSSDSTTSSSSDSTTLALACGETGCMTPSPHGLGVCDVDLGVLVFTDAMPTRPDFVAALAQE
mmetsp:Transcript_3475/g.12653  ORF Transcript_3475/g.12653 Transcript_3475/m.12653 type:complete len:229 (-) Transcript_3475:31-717(-)